VAVDPRSPPVVLRTAGTDCIAAPTAGGPGKPIGAGIAHSEISAVAVSPTEGSRTLGVVYAGTNPSSVYRSEDGGESWRDLSSMLSLPSASEWSVPPHPETHHVRWIEPDPKVAGRYAIGPAAVPLTAARRTDRAQVVLTTPTPPPRTGVSRRVYSAAETGTSKASDGGDNWSISAIIRGTATWCCRRPVDPDTVLVSAASGLASLRL
jgi:hypothetical protein